MTKKQHNKLVRDRIPEIIAADNRQYETEIMSDDEYQLALLTKLIEEAQEVATANGDDLATEIADLYEVIDALLVAFDLDKQSILALQQKRRDERGGFEKRIKLLWTE